MSNNPYLDTYVAKITNVDDPENPEIVEVITVKGVNHDHARSVALKNTTVPEGHQLIVDRVRPPTLVASPSDLARARRRSKTKAPQYGKRGNRA